MCAKEPIWRIDVMFAAGQEILYMVCEFEVIIDSLELFAKESSRVVEDFSEKYCKDLANGLTERCSMKVNRAWCLGNRQSVKTQERKIK